MVAEVIDPANLRAVKITAQKMYDDRMKLKSFHYTGLPVYLDCTVLPKGAFVDAFRHIYCPGKTTKAIHKLTTNL